MFFVSIIFSIHICDLYMCWRVLIFRYWNIGLVYTWLSMYPWDKGGVSGLDGISISPAAVRLEIRTSYPSSADVRHCVYVISGQGKRKKRLHHCVSSTLFMSSGIVLASRGTPWPVVECRFISHSCNLLCWFQSHWFLWCQPHISLIQQNQFTWLLMST